MLVANNWKQNECEDQHNEKQKNRGKDVKNTDIFISEKKLMYERTCEMVDFKI